MTLSSSSLLHCFTWMMERGPWLYERARVKQISPNLKLFFILIWRNFQFPFHVTFFTFSISFNDFYFSLVHIYLLAIPTSVFPLWFSHLIIHLLKVLWGKSKLLKLLVFTVMPCAHQPHCYYCTTLLLNGQKYPSLDRHHLPHSSEVFTVLLQ